MNLLWRLALLLCIGGLLAIGWSWIGSTPTNSERKGALRWQSSKQCQECHAKQYDEWMGSHHQIAYTNPEVRRLSDDFRNKDCQACHLPLPVSQTGFMQRSLPRQTRPLEGVGCIACHLAADGGIMAVKDNDEAPCKPRANADFASPRLCGSCHNQHQTTDQWKASPYPDKGMSCNHCHMREVNHVFPGAHDPKMLKEAGEFTVRAEDGQLHLTLKNKGAGHNFPTEERHRAVDMVYRFVTSEGTESEWQLAWRCRQPYRDEPGEDTQLPAGQEKTVAVPIPGGAVRAEARLWYRLNPYAKDDDPASTLLVEKELQLQ